MHPSPIAPSPIAPSTGPTAQTSHRLARSLVAERHWLSVASVAVAALFAAFLLVRPGGDDVVTAEDDEALSLAALLATIGCWWAARHGATPMRRTWRLLGLGTAFWTFGIVTWSWYQLVLSEPLPSPSAADIGFVGMLPFTAAAVLALPSAGRSLTSKMRILSDSLIVAGSVFSICAVTILETIFRRVDESVILRAVALALPVGDVVVLTAVLLVAGRRMRARRDRVGLLTLAVVLLATADLAYAYMMSKGTYQTGSLSDAGWLLGFLLIASAALLPRVDQMPDAAGSGGRPWTGALVTTLPVLVAIGVAGAGRLNGSPVSGLPFLALLAVIVLVVVRQVLVLLENSLLTRDLEAKVVARTAELSRREEQFRSLVQNGSDMIMLVSAQGDVWYQSPSVEAILGRPAAPTVDELFRDVVHTDDLIRLRHAVREATGEPGGTVRVGFRLRHADGRWLHTESLITNLLHEPAVRGLVVTSRDVSERHDFENALRYQAFHDPLTGLANRTRFQERVEHALSRSGRPGAALAVCILDLDGFKNVNDSFGHPTGDALLMAVAQRLLGSLRATDTLARLGGDEFAVLLEGESAEAPGVDVVCRRLLEAFDAPFLVDGQQLVVTASIGIAVPGEGSSTVTEEVLRDADLAMYAAKEAGKARIERFEPSMHTRMLQRHLLEAELRTALDDGQLVVFYQPTVSLEDHRIRGVEALVRWQHPDRGLVPPGDFIPLAEESGLIVPLGAWVLREACRQVAEWRRAGAPDLTLAVNLSARQARDPDICGTVAEALADSGLPAAALTLEITETTMLVDGQEMLDTLSALKQLGVQLAIDDFGTGYSSLSYLARLPVDTVKIDRGFVSGGANGDRNLEIAEAIVRLGHTFHLMTVAEGIETLDQATQLELIGCQYGQGFYFSRPVPATELAGLLAELPVAATAA
jgi:diguanylate cyclase (GGDEF)-like protein/PAS domain S-box-containing protein